MTGSKSYLNWRNGREISMKPINLQELRLGFVKHFDKLQDHQL